MIDSFSLFIIWLSFSLLVISATIPFVIWAIRSGQFSRFDYASRLALKSRIVEQRPADDKTDNENNNTDEVKNVSS